MKYVITGSLGHISKPLAETLLAAGHTVTIISSQDARKGEIEALGAVAAIGSVTDVAFLTQAFTGADAVYTMVPPKWDATNWKAHIGSVGQMYADALAAAGVKKVVNLSSIGAHMPEGCGPVSGLFHAEKALNSLPHTDVLHLRPGFFYYNFFGNIGMIRHMNIIGGNYGAGTKLVLSDTTDIAAAAAAALQRLNFEGKSVQYLVSDQRTTHEIAQVLGAAIGKPELPWIDFSDADALGGMLQAGVPQETAANYVEMGAAMRQGEMAADYYRNTSPVVQGSVKLEAFAQAFAHAFHAG